MTIAADPIKRESKLDALAFLGGPKSVESIDRELFHWPIVTEEDERAVLEVLRAGSMSNLDVTKKFEVEWGGYLGMRFNLAHPNGTQALLAAMYGCGMGRGDEIIVPGITFWASCAQAYLLGATPVFADIDPVTLCIDPRDIEHRITPRTKAIVVVHYCGHPADMDAILPIARRRGIKVIEDLSHAHGTLYKGRMCGSMGDVAGLSMMSGKSFAIGEGGMLSTNDRTIFERAVALCHYERIPQEVSDPKLRAMAIGDDRFPSGIPIGGLKGRLNQTASAMGRVQLKHYPSRIKQIQSAINRFWDLLDGVPGLRPHRPEKNCGSTMGGWYNPLGHYVPEELGGLPVTRFIEAVAAEGVPVNRGANCPLHVHPVMRETDTFGDGKPTRIAFSSRDVREPIGSLPVTEALASRVIGIPYFKLDRPDDIARIAGAFRKVALQAKELNR